MKRTPLRLLALGAAITALGAQAQLSTNPDKFLGNITTWGQINTDGLEFADLWNQLTPENESKWSSIEGNKDNFNWGGCDRCYNYCKQHNIPFKFHTLGWGSQYPGWMDGLNATQQLRQFTEWLDAIAARYPDLDMIDVVNEAIPGHAPAPYKDCLGGDGYSGYDWIIKVFEMAHERWPEAILIYNDYNTFQWQKTEFINLVKTLRDYGAPIDAYGCQSHDLTDMGFSSFKTAMSEIQSALKMPMYSSEYDIGTTDDQKQLRQYSDQVAYMWECDYVAGITAWGYIYGKTWTTDGNSGLIRNGQDRPAMTWLREYMASDVARNAKSPFPGMKKDHAVYIKPDGWHQYVDVPTVITVEAMLTDHEIDHVDLYVRNNRIGTASEAPYEIEYTPTSKGNIPLEAVVYDTEGNRYRRNGALHVYDQRYPYQGGIQLPGVIEAENFDEGGEGLSYHDKDTRNEGGTNYRTDAPGVDISAVTGGYAVTYSNPGEWLEYTVDIEQAGRYQCVIHASAGGDDATVRLNLLEDYEVFSTTDKVTIPSTGSWDTYNQVKAKFNRNFKRGTYVFHLDFLAGNCNIDKIEINCTKAGIDDTELDRDIESVYEIYTTTGMYVGKTDPVTDRALPRAVFELTGNNGIYVAKDTVTGIGQLVKAAN